MVIAIAFKITSIEHFINNSSKQAEVGRISRHEMVQRTPINI